MVNTYDYYDMEIIVDRDNVTDKEWAFLCKLLLGSECDPNDCISFTMKEFEADIFRRMQQ